MSYKEVTEWIQQPNISRILHAFSVPRTPREVERKLGITKLKMKPFLSKGVLKSLNPEGRKGRFYVLTDKGGGLLKLPDSENDDRNDWELIGWIKASPRQRLVVLQTMALDSAKRTSEEIRLRASRLNSCLTRISTKTILNELISKGLVDTEMEGKYRYYWLSGKGRVLMKDINEIGLLAD